VTKPALKYGNMSYTENPYEYWLH